MSKQAAVQPIPMVARMLILCGRQIRTNVNKILFANTLAQQTLTALASKNNSIRTPMLQLNFRNCVPTATTQSKKNSTSLLPPLYQNSSLQFLTLEVHPFWHPLQRATSMNVALPFKQTMLVHVRKVIIFTMGCVGMSTAMPANTVTSQYVKT